MKPASQLRRLVLRKRLFLAERTVHEQNLRICALERVLQISFEYLEKPWPDEPREVTQAREILKNELNRVIRFKDKGRCYD